MASHIISLVILSALHLLISGQKCIHTNLSKTFNFETRANRIKNRNGDNDSCVVIIIIKEKQTNKIIQTIQYSAGYLYSSAFTDCNFVLSYVTNKNITKEVIDYDFGDFIVADINFDGKEDVAVKNDSGGNGGPFYNFYTQCNNGIFKIDKFLTDSMGSFPKYINKSNKTLTTQIHANAYEECKNTYQFNSANNSWKLRGMFL